METPGHKSVESPFQAKQMGPERKWGAGACCWAEELLANPRRALGSLASVGPNKGQEEGHRLRVEPWGTFALLLAQGLCCLADREGDGQLAWPGMRSCFVRATP